MSPRDLFTSTWQALERAAVKRRSATAILRLLATSVRPTGVGSAPDEPSACGMSRGCATPATPPHGVDAPFEQWAALADAYAEQFLRMQRGDRSARDKAIRLSNAMLRMNEAMKCEA